MNDRYQFNTLVLFLLLQYGRAPIHWAASQGKTNMMEILMAANCDIEVSDNVRSNSTQNYLLSRH